MDKPVHPTTRAAEVLMFLVTAKGKWSTYGPSFYMPSVQGVLPINTSAEAQLRYMQFLQRKGLVGGCQCGCRGDYAPTAEGLEYLSKNCIIGRQRVDDFIKNNCPLGY